MLRAMSAFTYFFMALNIFWISYVLSDVNIQNNGESWMCNNDPEQHAISQLSNSDQALIGKLKQVHIFNRHGARVGSEATSDYFPNEQNLSYDCNVTEVTTREYNNNNYYQNASKMIYSFRKIYVKDEQLLAGNCKKSQSSQQLIPQFKANGLILKNAYIGNESYNLFTQSILNDISLNLFKYSQDVRVKLTSTDYERTIASLMVMASTLFINNNKSTSSSTPIFNINVHDEEIDAFTCYPSACTQQKEYKEWIKLIETDIDFQNTAQDKIYSSDFGQNTIAAFESEGGIWVKNKTGKELQYEYCRGMTLPLTNKTWWDAVQFSYDWESAQLNTSYALNKEKCIYHLMTTPILYKLSADIDLMRDSDSENYPKLIMHSGHDCTIAMLLKALGMWNKELVIFAEMLTLEIYSYSHWTQYRESAYLMRWTKKGKFIPYPYCDYSSGTELCDLGIMMNNAFDDLVDSHTWIEDKCANLVTACRCGYCRTTTTTTGEPDRKDTFHISRIMFWITFMVLKLF